MTTPLVQQYLAPTVAPYLTVAQFKTYPNWMDVDNLVPGNATAGIQDAALADVLLASTQWAENFVGEMPLRAHLDSRQTRTRTTRAGRLYLHPEHVPVRDVVSLTFGPDPSLLISFGLPSSSLWIEGGRQVSVSLAGAGLFFTGPLLQFGNAPPPEAETYVNWTYVAGYVNTTMSSCTQGATSITLADVTGVHPGNLLRIWDDLNVVTESVYVASTYVQPAPTWPPSGGSVPLAAGTQFAHGNGVGIGDMPRGIQQAVACYAIGLLLRPNVTQQVPFANTPYGPSIRRASSREQDPAGGLINEAERLLTRFAPTRWGN